jgi:hypothetical protein
MFTHHATHHPKEATMRPEIQAYMVQASVEIAKKQGFVPADENDVGCWMMNNREAIVKRAIEIQWSLLDRLGKNRKAKDALVTILSAQVWLAANQDKVNNIVENIRRPE